MKRHWSTRLLSASLALWFGLALLGPQAHQCPVHDGVPASTAAHASTHTSHDAPKSHEHCSCPQACCPTWVAVGLPAVTAGWTAAPAPVVVQTPAVHRVVLPPPPRPLLPFATAPPQAHS